MPSVAIVGAGVAGLHLALFLQRHGVPTVLYADRTGEQVRDGRLPNVVCRFGSTRERERVLGVQHWDDNGYGADLVQVRIGGEPPIAFRGRLSRQASYVDFRLYLPRLLADYRERGGRLVHAPDLDAATLAARTAGHDLTVVAAGGRSLAPLFPRIASRSAAGPARTLLAGLFDGVTLPEPGSMCMELVPGAGEIFQSPVYSLAGRAVGLTFEAVLDGPWARRLRTPFQDDPEGCARLVLDLLREAGSPILDRIDRDRFALTGPLDLLQGAITPTVRRPWTRLGPGRYAVAVGDAAVLNDPVTGQGANLASASAWRLGQLILDDPVFDERFCRDWARLQWELARPVVSWTRAALRPPARHVVDLMRAAGANQVLADAFQDNFDDPAAMWRSLATPGRARAFTARFAERADRAPRLPDALVVDRELRLLRDLAQGAGPLLDPEAVLVTADGPHSAADWDGTGLAELAGYRLDRLTAAALLPLDDTVVLLTYQLAAVTGAGPLYCSTLWRLGPPGWSAVLHQQSPSPLAA